MVWQAGKQSDVVIELLSTSPSERDKQGKLRLYPEAIQVSEYFRFDSFICNAVARCQQSWIRKGGEKANTWGCIWTSGLDLWTY